MDVILKEDVEKLDLRMKSYPLKIVLEEII